MLSLDPPYIPLPTKTLRLEEHNLPLKIQHHAEMPTSFEVVLSPHYHNISVSPSFGILELNLSKPITVFEGPLDSFMYRNSSATCGDKNDFPLEAENVRFFYDYDEAGRKSSLKKLEEGKQVFLWKKFLQDANIPESTHKMDLSDVLVYAKRKGIVLPKFNEYFSNSRLHSKEFRSVHGGGINQSTMLGESTIIMVRIYL